MGFKKGSQQAKEWGLKMKMLKKNKKDGKGFTNILKTGLKSGLNQLIEQSPAPQFLKEPLKKGSDYLIDNRYEHVKIKKGNALNLP